MKNIPKNIVDTYSEQREQLSHALAAKIIDLTSFKDTHSEILTYKEKADLVRWISRGEVIVSRINPNIFK